MTLRHYYKQQNSSSAFKMADNRPYQEFQYYKGRQDRLLHYRKRVEDTGLATVHGYTSEKQGIFVDQLLNPSHVKDLKKIKFFNRVSFVLNCMRIFMLLDN